MGSATTQALASTDAALRAASGVTLDVARELFAAAQTLEGSLALAGAVSDPAASADSRRQVVRTVFASFAPVTVSLLETVADQRWSSTADLITGVEELAVRAAAVSAPDADVEGELFGLTRAIAANPQLELALGSRLGDASAKGTLVSTVLAGRASEATSLIASSLVQLPRERRVRALLSWAMGLVADQSGRVVATVSSAKPLSQQQIDRLRAVLAQRAGAPVSLNVVTDPAVVGGIRVELGDEVIDATVASRLGELRQRLAG